MLFDDSDVSGEANIRTSTLHQSWHHIIHNADNIMKLMFLFAFAAVLLSQQLVFATPFANTSKEFYLRTVVTQGPEKFNNLYPTSWHTGAGLSVPALRNYKSGSTKSYFNGTRLNADLGTEFPWGWIPEYWAYAAWSGVDINAGIGQEGFALDHGSVTYGVNNSWVACDWVYGVPQLFWFVSWYNTPLPCSCAKVKLIAEFI
ncbi:hypothetical protein FN846DRAFT_931589 [Sphaerosporella brunnea]|uniref:DUF7907 domain-containing protein n=1 Tax=Sphaerosporella brunnea TaxID=1250544 RepID=A0A5J5F8A2_9PEZI|nr:hypothetical protein FN846DRAFT_931589 [Sphaerosporella brunnea]